MSESCEDMMSRMEAEQRDRDERWAAYFASWGIKT